MSESFQVFTGNCPKNVSKDAKYSIRSHGTDSVVTLTYITDEGERWLATTTNHPDLVEAVNAVKTAMGEAPRGQFYINEYGQVIAPVSDGTYYLCDGAYDAPLEFEFEGKVLSGRGVNLEGRALEPGDLWTGPHPGIPYVLQAGASDIYYHSNPRPNVTKNVKLSSFVGASAAKTVASRIQEVKGWQGGRFYVNEWWEVFAPVNGGRGLEYRYIGHIDDGERGEWFPKP